MQSTSAQVVAATHDAVENGTYRLFYSYPTPTSLKIKKPLRPTELVDKYTEYRIRLGRAKKKGIYQDRAILLLICKLIGFDDLNELDYETVEYIRDALSHYPVNASKNKLFNGLVGFDAINLNIKLRGASLSFKTIKSHIQKFSSFCAWCVKHEYISKNYFYKVEFGKKSENKRHRFSNEQLQTIFNIEQYLEHRYFHPYYYWIPLLLHYTGARLNELCQLYSEDVKLINGIYCIKVHADGDREVKTEDAIRLIPLHDELIAKGFVKFVENKAGRIFPELKKINGYYSHNASKWFARVREKLGLGKGFDAHSFRHTFIDDLKQLGVPLEVVECIVGHKHNSESFDVYSEEYNVYIKKEAIQRIRTSITRHIRAFR